jgi:hypothetical protein
MGKTTKWFNINNHGCNPWKKVKKHEQNHECGSISITTDAIRGKGKGNMSKTTKWYNINNHGCNPWSKIKGRLIRTTNVVQ